ncbi:MAG: DUF1700 domain-containing protein [Firmicutes bacterium]|nr:DUF1700 domain-containing protein [Bacillota bacterium]
MKRWNLKRQQNHPAEVVRETSERQYLETLRSGLNRLPEEERNDLVREIKSHIADAVSAGVPEAEVLQKLGPAKRLARAYTADALISRRTPGGNRLTRWFALIGLAFTASVPSMFIVPFLSAVGIALTIGGIAAIGGSILALFFPSLIPVPPLTPWNAPYLPNLALIVMGLVMGTGGVLALAALRLYILALAALVRKVVP